MRVTNPVSGIYKIEVPFEDIYTSVFAVTNGDRYVLIDSATTDSDVDGYVLPACRAIGFSAPPECLLLTHTHGDHAGGVHRLSVHFPRLPIYASSPLKHGPDVRPLADGDLVGGRLTVVMLPGHTNASVGFLDGESGTLISGDCLQLLGIGRYRNGIRDPEAYLGSIARLRTMPLRRILASHEYDPYGSVAEGEKAVRAYLDECERVCRMQYKP